MSTTDYNGENGKTYFKFSVKSCQYVMSILINNNLFSLTNGLSVVFQLVVFRIGAKKRNEVLWSLAVMLKLVSAIQHMYVGKFVSFTILRTLSV